MSNTNLMSWFEKGLSFEQYKTSMQVNQAELEHVYGTFEFNAEDHSFLAGLAGRELKGVVLTADWCGDATLCVPIIQRVAEHSKMELRYLNRDENLELMDQYLTNGTSRSIPIFIFMDATGQEVAVWGPRSPEVQEMVTALRNDLPAADAPDFAEKQQNMFREFKAKITTDPTIWRTVLDSVKEKLG